MGFLRVYGIKSRIFDDFGVEKGGCFKGFPLIRGGFWGKRGDLPGKCGKRGGLMSGAAARTGRLEEKEI